MIGGALELYQASQQQGPHPLLDVINTLALLLLIFAAVQQYRSSNDDQD